MRIKLIPWSSKTEMESCVRITRLHGHCFQFSNTIHKRWSLRLLELSFPFRCKSVRVCYLNYIFNDDMPGSDENLSLLLSACSECRQLNRHKTDTNCILTWNTKMYSKYISSLTRKECSFHSLIIYLLDDFECQEDFFLFDIQMTQSLIKFGWLSRFQCTCTGLNGGGGGKNLMAKGQFVGKKLLFTTIMWSGHVILSSFQIWPSTVKSHNLVYCVCLLVSAFINYFLLGLLWKKSFFWVKNRCGWSFLSETFTKIVIERNS